MGDTMTVQEAIEITITNLGNIAVPRVLNEQIGIPIDMAIANLRLCVDAMNKAKDQEGSNGDADAE